MLKLIIGVKGTGKTKTLIDMANNALAATKGSVVCIEKGNKLIYDIKYQIRLIDTDQYMIRDAGGLFGFISGIIASNHDVTDIFVDSALKIAENDAEAFEKMLLQLDQLANKLSVNIIMTSSFPVENATEVMKKFL